MMLTFFFNKELYKNPGVPLTSQFVSYIQNGLSSLDEILLRYQSPVYLNISRSRLVDIMDDQYVVDFLRDGTNDPRRPLLQERRRVVKRAKSFVMENGTLQTRPITRHPSGRVIPTFEERERILEWADKGTNHMGAAKLEKLVAEQRYWWSNLCADCVRTCQGYEDCRIATTEFRTPRTELEPVKVKPRVGRAWSIDLMGGFPETERGNRLVIIAVKRLTRWVEARAIPKKKPPTVAPQGDLVS
jgi:hypothetical protein